MQNTKLIIALIATVAVIIIAMAVYVFMNFADMNLTRSIILVIIAVVGLVLVMGILAVSVIGRKPPK